MNRNYILSLLALIGLIAPGISAANYQEDLKGKSQIEVIEYWLAENPHSAKGRYELMVATDAFTSRGYKGQATIDNDYVDLRAWVAKHKSEPKLTRNNLVIGNE